MPEDSKEYIFTYQLAVQEVRRLLGKDTPPRSLFENFRPQETWYLRKKSMSGIHGVDHEARVLIWQEILSRLLIKEGVDLDQEALRWSAATHDTQRVNDDYDFQHGERAAKWVAENMSSLIPSPTIEKVVYINRWHVPSDSSAPKITLELAVFKDSDGLDRARLGDLNPDLLRHQITRQLLITPAQELYQLSSKMHWERREKLFDCVMEAAVDLSLILKD